MLYLKKTAGWECIITAFQIPLTLSPLGEFTTHDFWVVHLSDRKPEDVGPCIQIDMYIVYGIIWYNIVYMHIYKYIYIYMYIYTPNIIYNINII